MSLGWLAIPSRSRRRVKRGVVGLVEDDEAGVDGEVGRVAGGDPDGVHVAPQPVLGLEEGDLVEGVTSRGTMANHA